MTEGDREDMAYLMNAMYDALVVVDDELDFLPLGKVVG